MSACSRREESALDFADVLRAVREEFPGGRVGRAVTISITSLTTVNSSSPPACSSMATRSNRSQSPASKYWQPPGRKPGQRWYSGGSASQYPHRPPSGHRCGGLAHASHSPHGGSPWWMQSRIMAYIAAMPSMSSSEMPLDALCANFSSGISPTFGATRNVAPQNSTVSAVLAPSAWACTT